jgi:exodeoxyribonuclease-3
MREVIFKIVKIATWNINSIRTRAEQLLDWISNHNIDIVLLQEIKCTDCNFPVEFFEDAGFNVSVLGQKTYNGVAILSRYIIEEVVRGNEIFKEDEHARYIEALINGYTMISVYVPNGVSPDSAQYTYKLRFLEGLSKHLSSLDRFIIGGDFNIALTDNDVYDPNLWREKICCTEMERQSLLSLINENNLNDCTRISLGDSEKIYTWWDYRTHGFHKNNGLRIDYIFTSKDIQVSYARVLKEVRALPRPSDHAPVVVKM